jgi:hypothetical protein
VESFFDLAATFSIYFTYISNHIKLFILVFKLNEIYELIDDAKQLIAFAKQDQPNFGYQLQDNLNKFSKLFNVYVVSSVFSICTTTLGFLAASILFGPPYYVPYVMWASFDFNTNVIGFAVMTFYQYVSPLICSFPCMMCDMMPAYFFCLIKGMLNELSERISSLDTDMAVSGEVIVNSRKYNVEVVKNERRLRIEVQKWIEIHNGALNILKKSQDIFSPIIFTQASISSMVLCTTAYSISMVSQNNNKKIILN